MRWREVCFQLNRNWAAISNPKVICFRMEIKGDLRTKDRNTVILNKPLQSKHPKQGSMEVCSHSPLHGGVASHALAAPNPKQKRFIVRDEGGQWVAM